MPGEEYEYAPDPMGRLGRGEWRPRQRRDPFGRLPRADPSFDFSAPLSLQAAVGRGGANRRDDVAKLEGLLALAGDRALLRSGPTGNFDEVVERALASYQSRRGLRVDGRAAPEGETMRALAADAARPTGDPSEAEASKASRSRPATAEEMAGIPATPLWQTFFQAVKELVLGPSLPPERTPLVGGTRN